MEEKLVEILKWVEIHKQEMVLIRQKLELIEKILELHRDEHSLAGNTLQSTPAGSVGGSAQGYGQAPGGVQGGPEFGSMGGGMPGPMGGTGGPPPRPGQEWENPAVGPGM